MSGEKLAAGRGGRVVEVNFQVGQEVSAGDVLIRLDTERLDNEIARRRRIIQAGEEELARLDQMRELLTRQQGAVRAKAVAELEQAEQGVHLAESQQTSHVRLALAELDEAQGEHAMLRGLVGRGAAAPAEFSKAVTRLRDAEEKLARARLPVEAGKVDVTRRALALVEQESAVKHEELTIKRGLKQSEVDAAWLELANLELEHRQTVIRAHVDGIVTVGEVKVGDHLEPGKPVLAIAQQLGLRIDLAVPSKDVAHLRVGMPARVKLDAFDHQQYGTVEGTVEFISPDSVVPDGQQTPYYQVKIVLPNGQVGRGDLRGQVKIGMTGQGEIVTGRQSVLSLLVKRIRQTISLG